MFKAFDKPPLELSLMTPVKVIWPQVMVGCSIAEQVISNHQNRSSVARRGKNQERAQLRLFAAKIYQGR